MASNIPPNISSTKGAAGPSTPPAALSQTGPISGGDGQRRSGGSGSFGSGANTRSFGGQQPRKGQAGRNQNKHSRRYRLVDEDAVAESAAMNSTRNRQGQTSITHLMTFALPPRPSNHHHNHFHQPTHAKRTRTWGLGSGYHVVDKARYARCLLCDRSPLTPLDMYMPTIASSSTHDVTTMLKASMPILTSTGTPFSRF